MKIVLAFALFACLQVVATAVPLKSEMVGHWSYAERGRAVDIVYKPDGTFLGNISLQGKVVWEFAGMWSLVGDMLNYQYTRSSLRQIPPGKSDSDRVLEVTSNSFLLQTNSGSKHRYLRLKEAP